MSAIGDQIRHLADNDSWFTLLNIEQDPAYRAIVDEVDRGHGQPTPASSRGACGAAWASCSPARPGSVTSAHFDIEHSFLLQLQGRRTLSYGVFPDDATRDEEVRRYWNGSFGRLAEMPEHVLDIELRARAGAYIPPYHPHWIRNSDATSLSLTVTFFNRDNADESMAQAFNERIRKAGLNPRPYGRSASGTGSRSRDARLRRGQAARCVLTRRRSADAGRPAAGRRRGGQAPEEQHALGPARRTPS